MGYCIVNGCSNRNHKKNWEQLEIESKNKKFSFHVLPKDIDRQNQWLEAIGLKNWKPCKTAAICSAHFKEEDFETHCARKTLKKDAVPHVPGIQSSMLTSLSSHKTNQLPDTRKALENTNSQTQPLTESVGVFEVDAIKREIIETNVDGANCSTSHITSSSVAHRSTSVSPERIFNSPNMINIREIHQKEVSSLRKQLSRARYNEKQAKKKVQTLRAVVKDLQKCNSTNNGNILRYLAEDVQELVKCSAKNRRTLSMPRRWKPSLFKFALSLHFYSPRAYSFLRYKFSNALPHPKTISKWCRTM